MLLIKCPKCQASYRLAESLYRRKAAGYGVVITCRRCKTQIHIDEGSLPPPAGTADQAAPETPEADVMSGTADDVDQERVTPNQPVRANVTPTPSLTTASTGLPPDDPSYPNDDTTDAAVTALPNVAPKPAAPPRPFGIPRPGAAAPRAGAAAPRAGAAAPRRQGTLLGIAPPTNALTPAPSVMQEKPKQPIPTPEDGWKPKLVALSPGLLGVQTATHGAAHGAPRGAKAPPAPPHLHHPPPPPPPPPPVPDEEPPPDSAVPLSAGSVELLDSNVDSKPPDSAMPLDSADYLSAPQTAPHAPPPPPVPPPLEEDEKTIVRQPVEQTPLAVRAKRLPQPPARGATSESKADETREAEAEPPRRRQASGDLTEDFLSTDVSFGGRAAAPALAPPDAGALTRAPVSTRPAAAETAKSPSSTKAPLSKSTGGEKKGSGRGVAVLLVMLAFGGVGYALQHRTVVPEPPQPEPNAAVNAPPPEPPPPVPAEVAPPAPTDTVASAPPSALAPAPPVTGATTPDVPPAPARPGNTSAPTTTPKVAKTSAERSTPVPTETADAVATTPTAKPTATSAPTSTARIEPRGEAGTEPFDVTAARAALDASAAQASGCRKEGDPSGVAVVTITFSQTGRVTTANVSGPPFQATPTGGCIASTMRKTRVPAFAGEMVTVRKTITVQ